MGPAGECFPAACLGLAVQQRGLRNHHAHHSMVFMVFRPLAQFGWPTWHVPSPRVSFQGCSVYPWPIGPTLGHHIWLSLQSSSAQHVRPLPVPQTHCL